MKLNNLSHIQSEIRQIAKAVLRNGWGEATSGNFSWNVTSSITQDMLAELIKGKAYPTPEALPELGGQVLLISASGSRMRTFAEGFSEDYCLIHISEDGHSYLCFDSEGKHPKAKPTSEIPAHFEVHRLLEETGKPHKAVLHTHMTEAVIVTHHHEYKSEKKLNAILMAMLPEMTTFLPSGVGILPYDLPGSQSIGKATAQKLRDFDVVFWEKHGCLSVGISLHDAMDKQEIIAKSLQVFFRCLQYGYQPEGLTGKQLRDLKRAYSS
ncbi:MAG: rhamnulose-1-phosphate aldolase [Bacteroidota bacterium]